MRELGVWRVQDVRAPPPARARRCGRRAARRWSDGASGEDGEGHCRWGIGMVQAVWAVAVGGSCGQRRLGSCTAPAGDARAPIADYKTVDATLTHHAVGGWILSASVRNLLNADAREPSPAPGLALPFDIPVYARAFVVQLSGKW